MTKIEIDDEIYNRVSAMGNVEALVNDMLLRYSSVPRVYALNNTSYERYISEYYCHGNGD